MLSRLLSLSQDYQEEISVAQENKQQLQVMGERLARASQDSKAAEIQHKLNKVSERWQHLLDLIAARWVRQTLANGQRAFLGRSCENASRQSHKHSELRFKLFKIMTKSLGVQMLKTASKVETSPHISTV